MNTRSPSTARVTANRASRFCCPTSPRCSGSRSRRSSTTSTRSRPSTSSPTCRMPTSGSVRNAVETDRRRGAGAIACPRQDSRARQIESMEGAFARIEIASGSRSWRSTCCSSSTIRPGSIPFVVIAALPLAFCGIVMSLFLTGTAFSIPCPVRGDHVGGWRARTRSCSSPSPRSTGKLRAARRRGRPDGRQHPSAAGADDRLGHVPRPDAHGDRLGEGSEQNAALPAPSWAASAMGTLSTLLVVPLPVHPPASQTDQAPRGLLMSRSTSRTTSGSTPPHGPMPTRSR